MDGSFPVRHYKQSLDLRFKSYEVFKISSDLWACCQPLPMQQILPKSAQNCQNLPKFAQSWNFEPPPNIGILVFLKKKNSSCRGSTRACFHRSDFQSNNFSYAIFILKKRPLYVNFSIPPSGNWCFSQGSTPCVGMRLFGRVPNSPTNKNPKRHISYLLENVVFLDPKRLVSPFGRGKINFFFNFACYDLANGKEWECKIW
jgi:hypothetical protein